ncbi:chain length determinant family protein [Synechococcus sp. MVIR-18-1]|nr:chain length determinant family protein [Synechococcus sp. MVIR-18-1]
MSSLLPDDEIDLREVLAAFRRRWIWVASGGLLGLGIAAGVSISRPAEEPSKTIRMVIDTTQSPCAWTQRKFQKLEPGEILNIQCTGEFLTTRKVLTTLALDAFGSDQQFLARVRPLTFGTKKDKDFAQSNTQLELAIEASPDKLDGVKASLENIKNVLTKREIDKIEMLSPDVQVGEDWISIEEVSNNEKEPESNSSSRSLALGLLGGLVAGSGAALIADRRSNRVFSRSKLLGQLGYPLWLALPTLPWSDQVAGSLVGQLAARLDRSLDWRVLSIAREHEAVGSLAQALSRQNEPELSCKAVAPLLNSIIRLGSNSRPIGLLVVVESGFNSSQALDDARLLLSQLSCVQSIGVVLAGVPLPSELTEAEKA